MSGTRFPAPAPVSVTVTFTLPLALKRSDLPTVLRNQARRYGLDVRTRAHGILSRRYSVTASGDAGAAARFSAAAGVAARLAGISATVQDGAGPAPGTPQGR